MNEDYRLEIDAGIGDAIIQVILEANPQAENVHIILMAFPVTESPDGIHERVDTPTFVTSMPPDAMKQVLIEIGTNYMPNASEPKITGILRK